MYGDDYIRDNEYYQQVREKELEWDKLLQETMAEETEEEFYARLARYKQWMPFAVYEVFPDGKKFLRMQSSDRFDCEVYAEQHKYDHKVSKLVIEEK